MWRAGQLLFLLLILHLCCCVLSLRSPEQACNIRYVHVLLVVLIHLSATRRGRCLWTFASPGARSGFHVSLPFLHPLHSALIEFDEHLRLHDFVRQSIASVSVYITLSAEGTLHGCLTASD